MVSSYKEFASQHLSDIGVSGGSNTTQQSFQNVTQSGVVTVTHDEDTTNSRIVQVVEFEAGDSGLVNTSLDFDLLDEMDFIQEDSVSGTDFVDGKVTLYNSGEGYGFVEQQKIQASDPGVGDLFGHAVSIHQDTAIVGAIYEDTGAEDAGAAYIFTRSGSTWSEQQKIQASDKEEGDQFGCSVSIYGDTVIVGAHAEDTGGTDAGAAYVFTRSGSTWTQQQKITASDLEAIDQFGGNVSINGDTVIVGAAGEDSNAGAVYIFTRSGSTWTEQQKIQASDADASDRFGISVSIYEDTVIVGAYMEDTGYSNAGAAYIFIRSGATWTEQQKIQASDKEWFDFFGGNVSINGDTVIVGATGEDEGANSGGAAYIFTRSGYTWTEQQKILASDAGVGDMFGKSVAIDGDTVVVGAYLETTGGYNAGAVYIFTRSGSTWTEQQKILASDIEEDDRFTEVAISGDTVIVGAWFEDTGGDNAGSAYIFVPGDLVVYQGSSYITTSDINHIYLENIKEINSCMVTNNQPTNTLIRSLVSFDGRSTWNKWSGSSWLEHAGGLTTISGGNTITEFQTGFTNLIIAGGTETLDFAFDLATTNNGATPDIDQITINYDEEGNYDLAKMGTDYSISHFSSTQTKVTKDSVGAENIKVNVLI